MHPYAFAYLLAHLSIQVSANSHLICKDSAGRKYILDDLYFLVLECICLSLC